MISLEKDEASKDQNLGKATALVLCDMSDRLRTFSAGDDPRVQVPDPCIV